MSAINLSRWAGGAGVSEPAQNALGGPGLPSAQPELRARRPNFLPERRKPFDVLPKELLSKKQSTPGLGQGVGGTRCGTARGQKHPCLISSAISCLSFRTFSCSCFLSVRQHSWRFGFPSALAMYWSYRQRASSLL